MQLEKDGDGDREDEDVGCDVEGSLNKLVVEIRPTLSWNRLAFDGATSMWQKTRCPYSFPWERPNSHGMDGN